MTAIEKYSIKGFPAPRTITSEAQIDHYTEVLYKLERRGHLSAAGETIRLPVHVDASHSTWYYIRA